MSIRKRPFNILIGLRTCRPKTRPRSGQPYYFVAALDLPPTLRRSRRPAQSGRTVGGGRYHRKRRRRISSPEEVLPRWRAGIEAEVALPLTRDIFWWGLYTGMRRGEILPLCWERVDLDAGLFRVEETKTGEPLKLPITRQLAAVLERRWEECRDLPGPSSRVGVSVTAQRVGACREGSASPCPDHESGRRGTMAQPSTSSAFFKPSQLFLYCSIS